ncbi:hypothetical protein K474DRAFT_648441 [Panus rudis PR-1116 ss-1]|nr:hypothetical protein K474DRAFT_648441 [Panus rudis PR-1116 ss-1]
MVRVDWSTPQRRDGDRHLAPLPIDIYLMIFDELAFDPTGESFRYEAYKIHRQLLRELCLVCRFFYITFSPKLFKHVLLDGDIHADGFSRNGLYAWYSEAVIGVEEAVGLMRHVKELMIDNWSDELNAKRWRSVTCKRMLGKMLPMCTSLHTLDLTESPIHKGMMEAIFRLPSLRKLRMRFCSLEKLGDEFSEDAFEAPEDSAFPPMTEFSLVGCKNVIYYRTAFARLASCDTLEALEITNRKLGLMILEREPNMRLTSLHMILKPQDSETVSAFLNRSPMIKDLYLMNESELNSPPADIRLDVHPESLPHLDTLICCPSMVTALFPGRAIKVLTMMNEEDWKDVWSYDHIDFQALAKNEDAHLEQVTMPIMLYHNLPIHEYIPKIDTFCICLPMPVLALPCQAIMSYICRSHDTSPVIKHLKIQPYGGVNIHLAFDLQRQRKIIRDQLTRAFPTAKRITLNQGLEWRLNELTNEWNPVVTNAESYRALLSSGDLAFWSMINVTDLERTFVGLFDGREMSHETKHRLRLCSCALGPAPFSQQAIDLFTTLPFIMPGLPAELGE